MHLPRESCFVSTIPTIEIATREYNFLLLLLELSFSFDGTEFGTAGSSKVSHRETFGLANYRGDALTTGCSTGGSCGVRTEASFQ